MSVSYKEKIHGCDELGEWYDQPRGDSHKLKVIPSEEVRRLMEHGGRPVTRTIYRYATSSYHEITHAEFYALLHDGEENFCVVVGRHASLPKTT